MGNENRRVLPQKLFEDRGDELNKENATGEDVQFVGVRGWISQCLRRHVAIGSRAVGGSVAIIGSQIFGHTKVGHLGSPTTDHLIIFI